MGKIKNSTIQEHEEWKKKFDKGLSDALGFDVNELPEWDAGLTPEGGHSPELSGSEILDLQVSVIKSELERLRASVEELHYKHKYYAEPLTGEQLEYIESELKRIIRDFT